MSKVWTKQEEAEALHQRFDKLKRETGKTQAAFARDYRLPGGASMLNQHIKNHRPINLEHALVYAQGFGVPLSEISPRLAAEVERAKNQEGQSDRLMAQEVVTPYNLGTTTIVDARRQRWPFTRVDYDKLVALQGVDARNLENALLAAAGDLDLDIRIGRSGKSKAA